MLVRKTPNETGHGVICLLSQQKNQKFKVILGYVARWSPSLEFRSS